MTKRVRKCEHLRNCQQCQDAIDAAVDEMLDGVLGPALEEEVGAEDFEEKEAEEEDSPAEAESQESDSEEKSSSDTVTTRTSRRTPSSQRQHKSHPASSS